MGTGHAIATGIDNAGQVIGYYSSNFVDHYFLYNGGIYTTINVPSGTDTNINGINNAGEIFGTYFDSNDHTLGFLYSGGTYTTIDPFSSGTVGLTGINNAGQVVGYYYDNHGIEHGFVATPQSSSPPVISSVSALPSTGEFGPGSTVTLTVNFSEAVMVAGGTPTLALNDGGTAFYTSGGSSALVFTYTVGALGSGQNTSDLALAATNAINLNGATITDGFGTAADLSGADGYNPVGTLLIDTTAPTVSSIAAMTDNGLKDLNAGHVVTITLGTSEVVNVTGTPTLQLNDNEVATYTSGTGTKTLTFTYTVQQGDNTSDLQVTGLNLPNGATVQDGAGNNVSGSVAQDLALQIDTMNPIVTSASASPSSGDLDARTKVTITLAMSEAVKVKGTPTLTLNDGGTATYKRAASTATTLVFDYRVQAGQNTANLQVTSVNLPIGSSVTAASGYLADFANALTTFTGLQIDTTPPTVSTISALPSSGNLNLGDTAAITLAMSEPVNVTGTPTLKLSDGGAATYVGGSGTNTLVFDYLVAGFDKPTSDLRVTEIANERSIHDLAGNVLSGVVTQDLGLVVEPPVNLTGSNLVIEMAELANEAYSKSAGAAQAESRNWKPLSAADLNLPASNAYKLSNGVFSASILLGEADALVLEGNVNGKKTLTVSFQGTSDLGQVIDWPNFRAYYSNFLPLIQAIGTYVQTDKIQQVLVTGHSLGGAMVQDFMADVTEGKVDGINASMVSGYTWGSPGADQHPAISKLVNFEDISDPVPEIGSLRGYFPSGTDIFINSPILGSPPDNRPPVAHQMLNYLVDTEDLVRRAGDQGSIFSTQKDAKALLTGDFSHANNLEVMPGQDQSNTVTISSADQFVLGGPGDDNFQWTPLSPGQHAAGSPTIIEGGAGIDTLLLPGLPAPRPGQAAWSLKTISSAETDLYINLSVGHQLVARLFDIEHIDFGLGPSSMITLDQPSTTNNANASLSLLVQSIASFGGTGSSEQATVSAVNISDETMHGALLTGSAVNHL